jgi:Cobalt transport protein.
MIFLTIRFIPLLISLSSQINHSASSRAFEIKRHPLKGIRIISLGLINSVVSFSNDVSMAMVNRGYTGVGKTSLNELNFQMRDVLFFVSFLMILLSIIIFIGFLYLTFIFWMYYIPAVF